MFDSFRFDPKRQDAVPHYKLLFRVAATIGRVLSVHQRRGVEAAADILPPGEIAKLATALRDYGFNELNAHRDSGYVGQLALGLVNVAFQLGDEHRNALLEASKPVVEKCPVDYRRQSVWALYERSGDIPRLRAWVVQWLADNFLRKRKCNQS